METIKITVCTTPTCGACKMLKKIIPDSEFSDFFDIQEINENNRNIIQEKNVVAVPTIFMEVGNRSQIITGYRPIHMIDDLIKEMINY
ncbi:MAG: hypothetical protein JXM74_11155 [Fusobacteriaceae bacterium]|nr:hypothetical protein [Fusobacteriaceae bacterium]